MSTWQKAGGNRACGGQVASTIAIDGPAASGKSTIGKRVAQQLGYLYLDTGVMYRAVTFAALQRGIDVEDEAGVTQLVSQLEIDVQPPELKDGRSCSVFLDGADVSWEIHSPHVDRSVSQVSMYKRVRERMASRQREIGIRGRVVMVGRDIGTVVLPDAELKVYLDASVEERARRRYEERIGQGQVADYQQILEDMRERDRLDSTRELAPLMAAQDAIVIDTTGMTIDEVVERVAALAEVGGASDDR